MSGRAGAAWPRRWSTLALLLSLALHGCGRDDAAAPVLEGTPAGPYRLTLTLDPAVPAAAEDTRLTFRLTHSDNGAPVQDLQAVHERLLHTFIVAEDFGSFAHIHHQDFKPLTPADLAAATLSFPYRFPYPGRYRIVSEFTHRDRSWRKQFELVIGDRPAPARIEPDFARVRHSGDYAATLTVSPDPPVAGTETALTLELARGGQPVTDLALHLGSEVHVALWRSDGEGFGHTHSYSPHMAAMMEALRAPGHDGAAMSDMMRRMLAAPAELLYPGPRIPVRYVFPSAGVYVLFMEVAPAGEARVFAFMLEVDEAGGAAASDATAIAPAAAAP